MRLEGYDFFFSKLQLVQKHFSHILREKRKKKITKIESKHSFMKVMFSEVLCVITLSPLLNLIPSYGIEKEEQWGLFSHWTVTVPQEVDAHSDMGFLFFPWCAFIEGTHLNTSCSSPDVLVHILVNHLILSPF